LVVSLVVAVVTGLQLGKAGENKQKQMFHSKCSPRITLVETPLDGLIKALKVGKQLQDF
jgi:hypothetical protein